MGRDKALLPINGENLLDRTIRILGAVVDDVLVVGRVRTETRSGIRWLEDEHAGSGPLGGLCTGLRHARHAWALSVACDLPYLDAAVLRRLLEGSEGYDAVVPRVDGHVQALQAAYSTGCLPEAELLLKAGTYRPTTLAERVRTRWVEAEELRDLDPTLRSFQNVNTPDDWRRIVSGSP